MAKRKSGPWWKIERQSISGKMFGKWTVYERVDEHSPPRYRCVCECGREAVVIKYKLVDGKSKQCKSCAARIKGSKYRVDYGQRYSRFADGKVHIIDGVAKFESWSNLARRYASANGMTVSARRFNGGYIAVQFVPVVRP